LVDNATCTAISTSSFGSSHRVGACGTNPIS
jgi:hypothetical protein